MDEPAIYAALAKIFHEIFGHEIQVTPTLSAKDTPGWDSFRHIDIIMAVEGCFALEFTTTELDAMRSLGDMEQMVMARMGPDKALPLAEK
jgi:acyl carrier protein